MRYITTIFLIALCGLAACNTGVSVGTRTGNTGVTIGTGTTGTGVSIRTGTGMAVAANVRGDFLYSGRGEAWTNNKKGLDQFLAKEYEKARETFAATLVKHPEDPDATYYLGLTLIYLDNREAGYARLLQYRDPFKNRIAQEVKWWAAYCQKRPDMTPEKIHQVMNKARAEGYEKDREEYWEDRRW